jgi:hypothetical protein
MDRIVNDPPARLAAKEGCLTCLAILATFRTTEGFTLIKSELVDRISIQNPHLYRHDAEKIVNAIFSEIAAAAVHETPPPRPANGPIGSIN